MPKYAFLVRETLKRNRLYAITASSLEEAEELLDGFKQKPVESAPANENVIVDDYEVIDVVEEE